MTFSRPQLLLCLFVAFVLGMGAVTAIGSCLACRNSAEVERLGELIRYQGELISEDAKRIAALEANQ